MKTKRIPTALATAALLFVAAAASVQAQEFWPPDIEGVTPTSGSAGTHVNVTGDDFGTISSVTFGGMQVEFSQTDESTVTFVVPNVSPNRYEIGLTNSRGSDTFCCFEVTQAPEPSPTATSTATPTASPTSTPPPDQSGTGCVERGYNVQCSELGRIAMPSQQSIQGEPVTITAQITLTGNYRQQGAQWLMFSVRNTTEGSATPVTISIVRFGSPQGDIAATRTEQPRDGEVNLWFAAADVPRNQPLTLEVRVGSTDRGGYQLETLVMPFDPGYAPLKSSTGEDLSLFSFTMLNVQKATPGEGLRGAGAPGVQSLGSMFALVAMAAVLLVVTGRRPNQ